MTATAIPEGFERHFRQSPLTDPWEPIYSKRTAEAVIIGLRLATPHTNSRGLIHGGLIAALADNAMGLSCAARALNSGFALGSNVIWVTPFRSRRSMKTRPPKSRQASTQPFKVTGWPMWSGASAST